MQPGKWLEFSMVALSSLGLLTILATGTWRRAKQKVERWQFPLKFRCHLIHSVGIVAGVGAVVFAGRQLPSLGAANWGGWLSFLFGFVLVLLVLSDWPEPLIVDREGVLKLGTPSSRIRWEDLSHIREYQLRYDRGIVVHSIYGKQLVISGRIYDSSKILNFLEESRSVLVVSREDAFAPISIVKVPR